MNWMDIIFLAVFIMFGIKGFFTGMIMSFTRLISIVVGLLVAYRYNRPLLYYLEEHWHWIERLSVWFSTRLQNIDLSLFNGGKTPIVSEVSNSLAASLLEILIFLFLLLITSRIIQLIGSGISGLAAFTLLGPLDRMGGIIFGLIKGFLIIAVFFALLTPLLSCLEIIGGSGELSSIWLNASENSIFVPYLKGLMDFITGFIPGISIPKFNQLIEI